MPKGTKLSASAKSLVQSERAPFVGYVNLTLTTEDKADYDAWCLQSDVIEEAYLSALELGYQFSNKFDQATEAFICTVSQFRTGKPDSGLLYTARSNHPYSALTKAIYVVARKLALNLANGYVSRPHRDAF